MFDARTRLFFLACLEDAAGAALKSAAPAPGSDQQKNRLRLRSRPKSGGFSGSGSATLVVGRHYLISVALFLADLAK